MDNAYENGVLIVWEIYPAHKANPKKKCSSCIGRCDKRQHTFEWNGSKNWRLKDQEEMKENLQIQQFSSLNNSLFLYLEKKGLVVFCKSLQSDL